MVEHIDDVVSEGAQRSPKSDHSLDRDGDLNADIRNNLTPSLKLINVKEARSGEAGNNRKMLSSKIKSSPVSKSNK